MKKENNRLLYPFANVVATFFPIGNLIDGGTCEFSTATCREKCCATHVHGHRKVGATKKLKKDTYKYFIDNDADTIALRIYQELDEPSKFTYLKPKPLLSWFASGDCTSALTNKTFAVIKKLHDKGIAQNGITRNKKLWKLTNGIMSQGTRFLLTKERSSAKLTEMDFGGEEEGMYSIPNYENGTINIVNYVNHNVTESAGCGGGYYTVHVQKKEKIKSEKYLELDCRKCFEKQKGCFTRLN